MAMTEKNNMTEKDQLNDILKKMYAKDLGLVEDAPNIVFRRKNPLTALGNMLWAKQSFVMKVAMTALLFAIISAGVYYYNFFTINAYQAMMEKSNVEAQLQRRNDLLPNLINSAAAYTNYEKNLFSHVSDVRSAVKSLDLKSIGKSTGKADIATSDLAKSGMSKSDLAFDEKSVLSKFQAVAEAYPALKASEAYTTLMKELSDTETRIAENRISYNKIANYYNSRLKMFPGNIFNFFFRFRPLPVFQSDTAAINPPKVE
ncbi:MAG: LemA family protein [Nitrospirae bacterium]|nr:LemA family protein [Nitrospirota bacterium]